MKSPITKSCMGVILEKPIVRRTRRLIRVRRLMCLLSMFCVYSLPTWCFSGVDMSLVGAPPIGVETAAPKRLQQRFQLQKDVILPSPKDRRSHGPTVVIDGMPQPPLGFLLAHITPHLIEL